MKEINKIKIVTFLIFIGNINGFSQDMASNDSLMYLAATLPNWSIGQTNILIDTMCILESPIELNGKMFNYKREYHLANGYVEWGSINLEQVFEYGNVNAQKKPNGMWIYKLRENWTPITGRVKNGNKIGWWRYNCSYSCTVRYGWNWIRTKTEIRKRNVIRD